MIYISMDIEGCSGFGHEGGDDKEMYRRHMLAVAGGEHQATGQPVRMTSFHGFPDGLDQSIQTIRTRRAGEFDLPSLEGNCQGLMMVGFHGLAPQTAFGHCYRYDNLWINDRRCGEVAIQILLAASKGVPTVLVAGNRPCIDEARTFAPDCMTVLTRPGIEGDEGPTDSGVLEQIRQAAFQAASAKGHFPLPPMSETFTLAVPFRSSLQVDFAMKLPYPLVRDGLIVRRQGRNFADIYQFLLDSFACCDKARAAAQ